MELLDNLNDLNNKIKDINFSELQNNFLNSKIGQIANFALDEGLKYLLPDFVEDEVIEIKDAFISGGFNEGINKTVENSIQLGKNAIGLFTDNFENINEAKDAVKQGELIEGISNVIDFTLNKLEDSNIISENISNLIKGGKNIILNNLNNNLENEFIKENNSLNNIKKYIDNWEKNYFDKNIDGLKNEYKNIEKEKNNLLPIENIFNNIKIIENLNNLINNKDFNFDPVYLNLAKMF